VNAWRERIRRERAERRAFVAGILLDCARALRGHDSDVAGHILAAADVLIKRAGQDTAEGAERECLSEAVAVRA